MRTQTWTNDWNNTTNTINNNQQHQQQQQQQYHQQQQPPNPSRVYSKDAIYETKTQHFLPEPPLPH